MIETKSFIDPNLAKRFYSDSIVNDLFIVSALFQKSPHKYSASIPSSKIFNLANTKRLVFYLFKFHNVFDGLLGIDNLKLLQAKLDFDNGYLVTPHTKIKLHFIEYKLI